MIKKSYLTGRRVLLLLLLTLLYPSISNSQDIELQLLDCETNQALTQVNYVYGSQKGSSNEAGCIVLSFQKGEKLLLSHVSYGEWMIPDEKLQGIKGSGVFCKEPVYKNLYPVNIVSVDHSVKSNTDILQLETNQKLAHDGGSLLGDIPSIQGIRKSGSYSFDPVLRGFKYDQINIVIDGAISATAACPNRMDPPTSQVVPNMTDKVEIIKGPHALRYGASFGGAINFVQAKGRFTEDAKINGRISSNYETNGNILRTESMIGLSNSFSQTSVFASYSKGWDYKDGNGDQVQAEYERMNFGVISRLKLNSKNLMDVQVNYNIANLSEFASLPMDLRSDKTWMGKISHQYLFKSSNFKQIKTSAYGSTVDHLMDNLNKPLDPRKLNAQTTAITNNIGARTELEWAKNNSHLFLGLDYNREQADGFREREILMGPMMGKIFNDNVWQQSEITKTGLFGEYVYQLSKTDFILAGRLNLNYSISNEPALEASYSDVEEVFQINPSVSFGIVNHLTKSSTLGFWLGRAQRSGSLTERFINFFPVGVDPYEIVGNPEVLPEVNNQIDVSYKLHSESLHIQADVFASFLQNYISASVDTSLKPRMPTSPGVRKVTNLDQALLYGTEVRIQQRIYQDLQYRMYVSYTVAQDIDSGNPLPEIAPLETGVKFWSLFLNKKLKPEMKFRYVAAQNRVSELFGEKATPDFYLIDIKLSYQVYDKLGLSFAVNNMMNQAYYEHLSRAVKGTGLPLYASGRSYFVSIGYSF